MLAVGQCSLCGKRAKLVKSHIIPEWAWKPIYDKRHRLLRIASHHRQRVGFSHSGEWDKFLCQPCEDSFKELDECGRAVIYSRPGEPTFGIETRESEYGADITGIDYLRMKLFQLSVLWKASVCKREFFSDVNVGEHESTIRAMLRERAPGDAIEYGCVMMSLTYQPNKPLHEIIDKPATFREGKWTLVRFLFAGCIWIYVLHQDAHDFPLRKYFLTPGAPLPLPIGSLQAMPGLVSHLREMRRLLE